MQEFFLDAAGWQTKDDFYDSFFRAVGAPAWHGRNFNALNDSIATGSINRVELPYRLVIQNYGRIGTGVNPIVNAFIDLIREIAAKGHPVEIRLEN